MSWQVRPGQSTLVFYTAHNLSDHAITGVSTYNVAPQQAGYYFNKIQCFCFEEQRLRPGACSLDTVLWHPVTMMQSAPLCFSSGPARRFLCMASCQWWRVCRVVIGAGVLCLLR